MIRTSPTGQVYSRSSEGSMGMSDDNYWKLAGYEPLTERGRAYEQWGLKLFGLEKESVGYEPEELCPCCRGEDPPPSGVTRCFKAPPPVPAGVLLHMNPQKRKPKP